MENKKLIEVALPLKEINDASAREKSIRHGHPSTLHLWWARRPLAAARAVIWSSLVDDPSAHPEQFPTEEDQNRERERLFAILKDLVVWENSNNPKVLSAAKAEILKSTDGNPPALLDPFAGGGAIPLEAQRLGLEAHAHDLNPVAVMINKAMIEIPPRFAGRSPVNPKDRNSVGGGWKNAVGLSKDVEYYGNWMKEEAFRRIGHLYPKAKIPREQCGGEATVIAWIWARTVKCPNPACGCEMPLVHSNYLSKKQENPAWFEINFNGRKASYVIHHEGKPELNGTINRKGAICAKCGAVIPYPYIRAESTENRMSEDLVAVVAEGSKGRLYIPASYEQLNLAQVEKPLDYPKGELANYPGHLNTKIYGLDEFHKLFTNRQLTALTTFSELVGEAQKKAEEDAVAAGMANDHLPLRDGGDGARAYGEAVGVYLAFVVDKLADYHSSICSWHSSGQKIGHTFARQALPMVWDYAEANPFCNSSGCFSNMMQWVIECIAEFPASSKGESEQFNAQVDSGSRGIMVSTDPPYYDNIGYADLSDYFYVWMRQSLKDTYPELFNTMLVPKTEELIATPYRHDGDTEKAKSFFENGMLEACRQMHKSAREDIPVTIYYAYKQSDADANNNEASSGWETMLTAVIQSGFTITGTWPVQTEMSVRSIAMGSNALASSIVLVCRKRPEDAPQITRRNLINTMRRELRPALQRMQSSNIAPVDLAQSAIGPGMAVFSRYRRVLEADGTPMSVRSALHIINEEIDRYFNEQAGELDAASRFCVDLYAQYAYDDVAYGVAEVLANAKGASISALSGLGVVYAHGGKVHLLERENLPEPKIGDESTSAWLLTQQLTHAMAKGGNEACARLVRFRLSSAAEQARELAYRLYTIADKKGWTEEAYAYNALVVSWPEIQSRAAQLGSDEEKQISMFE